MLSNIYHWFEGIATQVPIEVYLAVIVILLIDQAIANGFFGRRK